VEEFLAHRQAEGYTLWLSAKAMVPMLGYLRDLGVVPTPAPAAIVDVHAYDSEFGYRFMADELEQAGQRACERRVWPSSPCLPAIVLLPEGLLACSDASPTLVERNDLHAIGRGSGSPTPPRRAMAAHQFLETLRD
jgi:hypothetical protein